MRLPQKVLSLWEKRSLIFHFALLEIKMRYKESYLGFVWTAVEPLLMFIILYVVFTNIREPRGENFAIYLISGIIIYHLFSKGSMSGLTSLRSNQGILKSLSINRIFFPMVSTTSTAILMLVELGVFFSIMPFVGFIPSWTLVLFPLVIALLLALILGLSFFLSILYIRIPDIQPFWTVLVFAILFVSPVFWSVDEASGLLLTIQQINPLGQIIELAHKIVFHEIPRFEDWTYTSAIVLSIFGLGYLFFKKFEKNIVDGL